MYLSTYVAVFYMLQSICRSMFSGPGNPEARNEGCELFGMGMNVPV